MKRLVVVKSAAPRRTISDIRSARRRTAESKVVHLRAWTGHNVVRFPRRRDEDPTPVA